MSEPPDLPESSRLLATAHSLHALAEQVIAADLYRHTGKIGLRVTPGGFGTPRFDVDGSDRRVRVEGVELVVEEGTTNAGQRSRRSAPRRKWSASSRERPTCTPR